MEKDVLIEIVSTQDSKENKGSVEMTTYGKLSREDDNYILTYAEGEESWLSGQRTVLKVEHDSRITMTRLGNYDSQMILEKGLRHLCHYNTPYGGILFGFFAQNITSGLCEDGGELTFKYTVDINSDLASSNEVCIKVKEANNVQFDSHV